ncbi:TlpA family protein disulfide reductase [Sphingomonas sinipercae]|uniref:TlpA family protein disulfide reductase n=1 Tax=Sphingomonas sinipercae TaxID=2714944 RepID=A0A6G7ZKY4_9SPHN|nr:TlpA disulfide reductase family protein [Sphingomonas sinipercae]QIL01657.1 TlpA family protein disulfide reductase [Sphingomonas sinipercae]
MANRTFLLLLAASLSLAGCGRQGEGDQGEPQAEVPAKGADRSQAGKPIPDTELRNADDEAATLQEASGQPLLVNLWATWCAPCVKELPTLDALSRRPGAPRVVAVSQDMGPRTSVEAFLDKAGVKDLERWHDPKMSLSGALNAQVLPTTILYDSNGREVWRFIGDLDWTSAQAAKLLAEAPAAAGPGRAAGRR